MHKRINRTKDEFPYPVKFIKRSLPRPVRMILTTLQIIKGSIRSDVIFSNGLYEETGIAIRLTHTPTLGKIVGDPVWERVRNSGKTTLTIDSFNNEVPGGIQRKLLSFALNGFSGIITPSQQLADQLSAHIYEMARLAVGGLEPNQLAGFQQRSCDLMGKLMERGL
jgi:hypothetical protein